MTVPQEAYDAGMRAFATFSERTMNEDLCAGIDAAAPYIAREAQAEELERQAGLFSARLTDGTSNGRAYNAYTVARMLADRAAELRGQADE